MRLEAERKSPIDRPSDARVRSMVLALRSYGPCSYASISDDQGNYLQVAGGGQTCLLERRDATTGAHFRAHHNQPSQVFAGGTILAFSGGEIRLEADEWFTARAVADAFSAFLAGKELPKAIQWRDVSPGFLPAR